MNKQRTKTTRLAEGIKAATNSIFYFVKYYLATVVLAVAFFVHFFLPHPEPGVVKVKDAKSEIQEQIESHKDKIVLLAGTGSIEILGLKAELAALETERDIRSEAYSRVAAQHRVFGYPSRHKFVWSLGLGIMFLVLAMKVLYDSHSKKNLHQKISSRVLGLMAGIVAGYFFAWIFYTPATDLPYNVYMITLVCMGLLASVAGYFLSKAFHYRRTESLRLHHKIDKALDFFVEIRNVHFKNVLRPIIKKDLYDETLQEEIKKETKTFEKRMHDTADDLLD